MKIAHFGSFDVENYGDLLFPLILERRLSDICQEFVHVSPVGSPPVWGDCVESIGFGALLQEAPDIEGVVIGGGHILHALPTPLENYDRGGISPFVAYPSLWLGAAYVAAKWDLPLCWNGTGVPTSFAPISAQLVQWTASVSDYISIRDRASKDLLQEAGVTQPIHIVPDTGLDVSKVWAEDEISEAYENAFAHRNRDVPDRTLAFQFNPNWANEDIATIAARIDRICEKLRATAVLIATGPCNNDDHFQRQVAQKMTTHPLLIDRPQSLREITACIAHSQAYLGSSLHGMVTACSFGRRGILVASNETSRSKFTGFLEQFDLSSWLTGSWAEAEQRIDDLFATPISAWERVPEIAAPILDRHWIQVREALASRNGTPRAGRQVIDKHSTLRQLEDVGRNYFGEEAIFQGIITESLEDLQSRYQRALLSLEEKRGRIRDLHNERRELIKQLQNQHQQLQETSRILEKERRRAGRLGRRIQRLEREVQSMKSSRPWKILMKLRYVGARFFGK